MAAEGGDVLCIVTAMRRENRPWRRRLSALRFVARRPCRAESGLANGKPVLLLTTGIGERATRTALEWLFDGNDPRPHGRPSAVVAAGFLGGLHPELPVGSIVLADRVLHPDGRWLGVTAPVVPRDDRLSFTVGPIVTSREIVASVEAKCRLHGETGAVGVDMESAYIVETCRRRGIPCCVVRGVSDAGTTAVPAEVPAMMGSDRARWPRLLPAVLRRPALARELVTLARGSRIAAVRLADALDRLCAAMPWAADPALREGLPR